jgi:hypothetical protein
MADIRVNSQGNDITDGDGSGINAGILDVIRTIRYVTLVWAIEEKVEKSNQQRTDQLASDLQEITRAIKGRDIIDVEWEDTQQKQFAATEQKLLTSRDSEIQVQSRPLIIEEQAIPKREDVHVEIQVGAFRVADSYLNLEKRLNDLTIEQRESLRIAAAGGLPEEAVIIQVTDTRSRNFTFSADSEHNSGWVSDRPGSLKFSSQEIKEELSRQDSSGVLKIRDTMREAFDNEDEPWIFRGERYTVLADADTVIVVGEKGLVKDVTELSDIGEKGWNVAEQIREASADFNSAGTVTVGNGAAKVQRQVELTQ